MQCVGQGGKLFQTQLFTPDGLRQAAGQNDLPQLFFRKPIAVDGRQGVEQCLAPLGKGGLHNGKNSVPVTRHQRFRMWNHLNNGGSDLGRGEKTVRRDLKQQLAMGMVLTKKRKCPAVWPPGAAQIRLATSF